MSFGAVVAIIGLGIGVAANPPGITLVILLMMNSNGMKKALAYVLGSVVTETLIIVAVLLFIRAADRVAFLPLDLQPGPADIAAWVVAVFGAVLVVTGAFMLRRSPRKARTLVSRVMRDIDSTPAWLVFAVGASLVSWTMPVLAAAEMEQAQVPLTLLVGLPLYLVFMTLALSTVVLPIAIVVARPRRSRALLESWRRWLERNGTRVAAIVTMAFGAAFAWRGIAALLS